MKRATRNRILVWVIFLGLLNFAVYTFAYWCLQGDARNGGIRFNTASGAPAEAPEYILRGHFLRVRAGKESAAALVFYTKDDTFGVISHEGGSSELVNAIAIRDSIAGVLRQE